MKMKLWDRLILRLGAVITLLTGAVAIADTMEQLLNLLTC